MEHGEQDSRERSLSNPVLAASPCTTVTLVPPSRSARAVASPGSSCNDGQVARLLHQQVRGQAGPGRSNTLSPRSPARASREEDLLQGLHPLVAGKDPEVSLVHTAPACRIFTLTALFCHT